VQSVLRNTARLRLLTENQKVFKQTFSCCSYHTRP